tara:strand:- start:4954 stop:6138 length:1185 start_codon:yes stop_codon:yes gene_type:complete
MNSITNICFNEKRAFIRADFNVPFNNQGLISDNSRIVAALPTIRHVLSNGGSCILASHLGRPNGIDLSFSLRKILFELSNLLQQEVFFCDDCVGDEAVKYSLKLKKGQILLLENLRFYKEETNADEEFAKRLASLADVYINDAYATTHREHASTVTMAKFFKEKCAGILLQNEINNLKKIIYKAERPVTAIIGGAKVSSKISVIANILDFVDNLIIGGGMAFTFVKHNGGNIGDSIFEHDSLDDCAKVLRQAKGKNVNIFLPVDVVVSNIFSNHGPKKTVKINDIPDGWQGLDIGQASVNEFKNIIHFSSTILWNGPMGVFEFSSFSKGTKLIAEAVAEATKKGAFSLAGGGDSVAAIKKFNLQKKVSFISTGGGAMLEGLEGKALPGINALTQ